jgi:hypothetical protein
MIVQTITYIINSNNNTVIIVMYKINVWLLLRSCMHDVKFESALISKCKKI